MAKACAWKGVIKFTKQKKIKSSILNSTMNCYATNIILFLWKMEKSNKRQNNTYIKMDQDIYNKC